MTKQILVPINNLETLDAIINELVSIQTTDGDCNVTLFHVLRPVEDFGLAAGYVVETKDVRAELEHESKDMLDQACQRLLAKGIKATTLMLWGEPAEEICRYAEEQHVDLIIVGSTDKSLLEKLLIGSVSQKIVQNAPSNVLVVK